MSKNWPSKSEIDSILKQKDKDLTSKVESRDVEAACNHPNQEKTEEEIHSNGTIKRFICNAFDEKSIKNKKIPFPSDTFPIQIQKIVNAYALETGTPHNYWYSVILVIFSLLIGNGYRLKESEAKIHTSSLWIILSGRSGVGKSPVLDTLLKPLFKRIIKEDDDGKDVPSNGRSILTGGTFEGLLEELMQNRNGVILAVDEFIGFIEALNMYRKGNDLQILLSLFTGSDIRSVRKTVNDVTIRDPFLSIVGGIQPNVLAKDLFQDRYISNGLTSRFLYTEASDFVIPKWSEKSSTNGQTEACVKLIDNAVKILDTSDYNDLHLITFSKEGLECYGGVFNEFVDQLNKCTDAHPAYLSAVLSKSQTCFAKLCLVLHVMDIVLQEGDLLESKVEVKTVEKAASLINYFLQVSLSLHHKALSPKKVGAKKKYNVDWSAVFGDSKSLKYGELEQLLLEMYGMSARTAQNSIQSELKLYKDKRGVYCR